MKTKRHNNARSLPLTIGRGMLATIICLALGCMLITTITISGSIEEGGVNNAVSVLTPLAALAGSFITVRSSDKHKIIAAAIYLACVLFILSSFNILMFEGEFQSSMGKGLLIFLGTIGGCLAATKPQRRKRKIKSR